MKERIVLCLELEAVVISDFHSLREGLAERGICFRSLTEEQTEHPQDWLTRFADMDNASRTADPFAPRTLEEIARRVSGLGPEPMGCIVADDGRQLVGYTYFHRAAGEDVRRARQGWTGVRPECRRGGIATALKIEGILLARRLGYESMVTDPRADNLASLKMSLRVGFQPCDTDGG